MTVAAESIKFTCPRCKLILRLPGPGPIICGNCRWRGDVYLFSPVKIEIDRAEVAMPDDATCIHHPTKRATATCSGTGDYICALCAVEIKGKTYSVQYLENAGRQKVNEAYAPVLDRPDRILNTYLVSIFIPGINYITVPLACIWAIHGFVLRGRAVRLRQSNPLYARLVGKTRLSVYLIALTIVLFIWAILVMALIVHLISGQ